MRYKIRNRWRSSKEEQSGGGASQAYEGVRWKKRSVQGRMKGSNCLNGYQTQRMLVLGNGK